MQQPGELFLPVFSIHTGKMVIKISPGTRQEGSFRATVINLWKVRLHKWHCGDIVQEQLPQPPLRCSSKQKNTPATSPAFHTVGPRKNKGPDPTKVAVRSRKEHVRKMAIEISITVSHGPAGLSVRDSSSYPVGSQPRHSHQMPAASTAQGKFLVSRTLRERVRKAGSRSCVSQNHLSPCPGSSDSVVLSEARKQPNKYLGAFNTSAATIFDKLQTALKSALTSSPERKGKRRQQDGRETTEP